MGVTKADTAPCVWIGCLHHYNSGFLVGEWFPVTEASDVTLADVHRGSGQGYAECEELWCMDIDGLPVNREMDPMEAALWGEIYDEVGHEQWPALCAWVRSGSYIAQGDTDLPSVGDFEEAYVGCWDSFRDYAFHLSEDIGLFHGLPDDHVAVRYFSWDSWIRDLEMDYSVEPDDHGGVHIFRSL